MSRYLMGGLLLAVLAFASAPALAQGVEIVHSKAVTTRAIAPDDLLPGRIRLFVSDQAPMQVSDRLAQVLEEAGVTVDVHHVDELAKAEAALNASLPKDMAEAEALMKRRIADGMALDQEVQRGWLNVMMVRQFQIQRVPAVVFDDSQVVYGEYDLERALRHYQVAAERSR
ncbi:DUF1525 domain-containing protein [Denitratimonas sp. CY0512]|uniref:DUF1525 domain-containing protein n=1 Tax=Denitratimonas sp. CY0512 TaxID=3131940 RepID=UPI0030B43BE5